MLSASPRPAADANVLRRGRHILLVEDDESLAVQVVESLRRAGFDTVWIANGTDALKVVQQPFSLVILDLMLPGTHGLDVLKSFRKTSDVPILVLSARNESADKIRALKIGADDFVSKPFWPEELLERVHARLRRPTLLRGGEFEVGPVAIDLEARSVSVGGVRVELTKVEFDLLAALARRAGDAVSREALSEAALGPDREGGERTLDVHMSRLRKKLGEGGRAIATVWGVGYRLEVTRKR
jgi:two-component system response regulator MtrA